MFRQYRIILVLIFLTTLTTQAQRKELRFAQNAIKKDIKFNAAYFSAQVLANPNASKSQVRKSRKILVKYIDVGLTERERYVAHYEKKMIKYHRDSSVTNAKIALTYTKDLNEFINTLNAIPKDRIEPIRKKDAVIILPKKSYKTNLEKAEKTLSEIKERAAKDYLTEADKLSNESSLEKLIIAFNGYSRVSKLNSEIDISIKKALVGNKIGRQLLEKGNNQYKNATSIKDKEKAIALIQKASTYSNLDEISNQKQKLENQICELYYSKSRELIGLPLEGSLTEDKNEQEQYEIKPIKVSIDKEKLLEEIAKKKQDNTNSNEKVNNKKRTSHNNSVGLDNSYKALEYLDKIKRINSKYKDIAYLKNIALKGTWLIDNRDNKRYGTTRIGNQIWMTSNLDYSASGSEYKTYCKGEKVIEMKKYGRFYNWYAVMKNSKKEGSQGICPTGWRVPTIGDYKILQDSIIQNRFKANWQNFNPDFGGNNNLFSIDSILCKGHC